MNNREAWNTPEMARIYGPLKNLTAPERKILDTIFPRLKDAKMLDIGVGGGRTTLHFAPLVKEYIGIDYSERMIKACQSRFPNLTFSVMDVRDMLIPNDSFDFILFSHSGLDCCEEGREEALKEIHRVGNFNSTFIFSCHNLNGAESLFRARLSLNPMVMKNRILTANKFKREYGGRDFDAYPSTFLNDGSHDGQLMLQYTHPAAQIRQLTELGFDDIRLFGENGEIIVDPDAAKDVTIYYMCRIRKELK